MLNPGLNSKTLSQGNEALSQLAIDFPAEFIRDAARHQSTEAPRLYREGVPRHPNGGMQALLDHRQSTVEALLAEVKTETALFVPAYWQTAAFTRLNEAAAGGGSAPGQYLKAFPWEYVGGNVDSQDYTLLYGRSTKHDLQYRRQSI